MRSIAPARLRRERLMTVAVWSAGAIAVVPLIAILVHIVLRGASALSPGFFVRMPAPAGVSGGGMGNAIVGTLLLLAIATAISVPIGLGAGLFLAANARSRSATLVRFLADVLSGVPSIVIGVFVWELIVRPTAQFSALAGGVALGLLTIPVLTRATEELVQLVPTSLAESARALGFPEWRTAITIVLRTALPGVATAAFVALARAAGEAAPLLLTAFGNPYWSTNLMRPIAALPLQIYAYAGSAYDDLRSQAWAGALVLLLLIALLSLLARAVLRARQALLGNIARRAGSEPL